MFAFGGLSPLGVLLFLFLGLLISGVVVLVVVLTKKSNARPAIPLDDDPVAAENAQLRAENDRLKIATDFGRRTSG